MNPLLLSFNNSTIRYVQKTSTIANNKQYDVYIFSISTGNTSAESDIYEVYYMKAAGIIGVVNKEHYVPSFSWPKYILKDIQDEKGKSIIDKVMLKKIISQAITY